MEEIENESLFIGFFNQRLGRKYGRVRSILQESLTNSLQVSTFREFPFVHNKSVLSLGLDSVERRFLLSGGMDCKICLFDLESTQKPQESISKLGRIPCVGSLDAKDTHSFSVSCVCWYSHDTGMFFSGGFDKAIRVWDSNKLTSVSRYRVGGQVYSIDFSKICQTHSLLAIGCEKPEIRLCDLRCGKTTVMLRGHDSSVLCVKWSPYEENQLVTSGKDGRVFIWDVRRPGWLDNLICSPIDSKTKRKFTRKFNFDKLLNKPGYAHSKAAVNGMQFLNGRNALLTIGRDKKMKLWNLNSGTLEHCNFPKIDCYHMHQVQFAVACNDKKAFVPNDANISIYNIANGENVYEINSHFDTVNSCVFNPKTIEMYSAASDGSIMIYNPKSENKRMKAK